MFIKNDFTVFYREFPKIFKELTDNYMNVLRKKQYEYKIDLLVDLLQCLAITQVAVRAMEENDKYRYFIEDEKERNKFIKPFIQNYQKLKNEPIHAQPLMDIHARISGCYVTLFKNEISVVSLRDNERTIQGCIHAFVLSIKNNKREIPKMFDIASDLAHRTAKRGSYIRKHKIKLREYK